MRGTPFRPMAIAVVAMLALMRFCALAQAHASLLASVPEDGSVVGTAPSAFSLTFNEPVSPIALRLVKPDGTSLGLGRFTLEGETVEIAVPPGLGLGTHILSWRVISADGHPVGGSVVFSIGETSAAPPQVGEAIDWTVRAGLWAGKVALYVGLFLGVGGAFAIGWLLRDRERHGRMIVLAALTAGLLGAVVSAGFQGLDVLGAEAGHIVEPAIWAAGVETSFGLTLAAATAAFAIGAASLAGSGALARPCSLAGLLLVGLALALSGHASAAEPQWLTRPAVFLHGTAIAFWTGALVPLGMALRRAGGEAAPALRRFSRAIPYAVAILVAAGVALGVIQVERPAALVETAYGRVFLIKLALLVALFALAAFNRRRLTKPAAAGDASAARRLARSIAAETAIVLLVLAAVACWRLTPPPRALAEAAAEPAHTHIHTAQAMADITLAPGHAGAVEASVAAMTGDFGPLAAKEMTLVFSYPAAGVEPIRRAAVKAADGTWRVDGLVLPLPGAWRVRLDILVSDFEEIQLDGEIRVRP